MKKGHKTQKKLASANSKVDNKAHRSVSKPDGAMPQATKRRTTLAREKEESYRRIVETANEGIWEIDKEARTVFVNQRMAEMLGYSIEEILGRSVFDFLFPEDYPEGERRLDGAKQGLARRSTEFRYRRKDGSALWSIASRTPKLDAEGNFDGSFAMISDITELKKAQDTLIELNRELENRVQERTAELQKANKVLQKEIAERKQAQMALEESHKYLQELSRRLVEVQEEERRAIARELHDRVGQNLSALKLDLGMLEHQRSQDPVQHSDMRLKDSLHLVDETTKLVRDLLNELRPVELDTYGLKAAMQIYIEEFSSRYNIKVALEIANEAFPRLNPSLEITLLRIAQEALTNIARHSQADQATLSLRLEDNITYLTISDTELVLILRRTGSIELVMG